MDSGLHAWASVISMRAGILPVFVSPRQCKSISLRDNDLRIPHHELRLDPHFSTLRKKRQVKQGAHRAPAHSKPRVFLFRPSKYTVGQ